MKIQDNVFEAIDKFLSHIYDIRDESVIPEDVEDTLTDFASYIWGMDITIDKVTTEDIAMYLNNILGHQGKYHRKQRMKIDSEQYIVIVQRIQKFFDWSGYAYRMPNPFIPDNLAVVCDRIQPIDIDMLKRIIKLLNSKVQSKNDQTDVDAKEALQDIALLLVMLDAGLRAEELTRLKIEDVDLNNNMVTIHDVRNKVRKVPISSKLIPRLNAYIHSRYPETVMHDALLFPKDEVGNPLDSETIHKILIKLGNMVGFRDINALRFRATFAKNYHDADMLDDHLIGLLGIYNKQQLRLYVDRFGNKKLRRLWDEYFKSFQSSDPAPSDGEELIKRHGLLKS